MAKTINGKSLKEILQELQADFPKEAIETRDYDGVKYIGVDAYRDRLDTVIGVEHYNEKYDPVELVQAQDSYATKTRCILELLDDDYNVILTKESSGGSNIAFPKIDSGNVDKDGKPIKEAGTLTNSLPNDFDSACQDAFKRICKKQFGMGKRQLEEAKAGTLYILKLTKDCTLSSSGHIFSNGTLENDGKTYNLAIFKNTAEIFQSAFNLPKKGERIAIYGKVGVDRNNNPQIVFNKPGKLPHTSQSRNETNNGTSGLADSNSSDKGISNPSAKGLNNQPATQNQAPASPTSDNRPVPQANTKPLEVKELSTSTLLQGYGSKGNLCFKAYSKDNKEYTVVIGSEDISSFDSQKWTQFKEQAQTATQIKATIKFVPLENGTLLMKGIA